MPIVALSPDAPSVSSPYAQALDAFLGSHGLPIKASPGEYGWRIGGTILGSSLVAGSQAVGDPTLAIRFGTRVGCAGFGLLGIAAATAPRIADAVGQLQRFEALTSTLGQVQVRRVGASLTLAWWPTQPVVPAVVEAILAGWISYGRYLLDEPVEVRSLEFAHGRCAATSAYEQLLQCPVRFGATCNSVTISVDLLDARPRFADMRLNKAIGRWLDGCTAAVAASPQLQATRRVARLLATAPALDDVDEGRVATALGVARRTLQRQLAAEGSGFRALLDAARAQHAIVTLLHDAPRLTQLGADLGFSEQSSLCRACRRWTGYAPLPLRARLAPLFQLLRPEADERSAMRTESVQPLPANCP